MATIDVLGIALTDPKLGQPLLLEREDGHRSVTDLGWWLRRPEGRPPADLPALDWATAGPVIDVGCATGRHLELLAERGLTAHGIDLCAPAVVLARAAGLRAVVADALRYQPGEQVATVLALGGGLGIAGTRDAAASFLARLAGWLSPTGSLIVTSIDWTAGARHRDWINEAETRGRYPGEMTVRLRYGGVVGSWFRWLWLDLQTLHVLCAELDLHVAASARWGAWYGAVVKHRRPQ